MDKIGRKLDVKFLSHLQGALDYSPACIIIAEAPSGEIIYMNEAVRVFRGKTVCQMTGIEIEEYIKTWKEFNTDGKQLSGAEMPLGRAILFGELVNNEEIIVELDDGSRKWALASAAPIYNNKGSIIAGLVIWYDITKQKNLESDLQLKANFDYLTGIYSRQKLLELMSRAFIRAVNDKLPITFLMFDLDHFKNINDQYGHSVGDEVLKYFSDNIARNIRSNDIFGRFGGEEFLVCLPDVSSVDGLNIAEKLREGVANNIMATTVGNIQITTSIGVFTYDGQESIHSVEEVISIADQALYRAKKEGRNCCFSISK